jgi:hypothetical protein
MTFIRIVIIAGTLWLIGAGIYGIVDAYAARKWPTPPAWWMNSTDMRAVRWIESKNGAASTNLYGVTAPAWRQAQLIGVKTESRSAWSAPRPEQHYVAFRLWRYYHIRTGDGCHAVWGVWDGAC